jgi:hypothetical protein
MPGATAPPKTKTKALDRPLIFYTMDEGRLALIRHKVSSGKRAVMPTDEELAGFLELLDKYDLDVMAAEARLSKTQPRNGGEPKLLVMVGRNGLRKIARRNGLDLAGDVVHAKDRFKVKWHRDPQTKARELMIEHEYEGVGEEARGPILGAWAESWDRETGRQMGYFFAPVEEYKPTDPNALLYGPWGHQESVMILTAAERTALRQATPLGGLLADGEEALIEGDSPQLNETELVRDLIMDLDIEVGLKSELFDAITDLNGVSPNAWGIGRAQMTLPGRDDASIAREIEDIKRQAAAARERAARERRAAVEEVVDAVVVPDVPKGLDPDAWESALSYFKGDVKLAEESLRRSSRDSADESGDPVAENAVGRERVCGGCGVSYGQEHEPGCPDYGSGRKAGEPAAGDVAEAKAGNPSPQQSLSGIVQDEADSIDAAEDRLEETEGASGGTQPYPCPNCGKDWHTEHTKADQTRCLAEYEADEEEARNQ